MTAVDLTIYFDLETGGVADSAPDIQLAAIAVDESTWSELETFERKIAFDVTRAEPQALELNHYSADAWKDAITERAVVSEFSIFLRRYPSIVMMSRQGRPYGVARLCGHNAATFDGPRLRRMFERHHSFAPWDPRVRCTMQRALWFFDEAGQRPPNYKLTTLAEHFGIPIGETHEALADVRLTVALAREMRLRAAA